MAILPSLVLVLLIRAAEPGAGPRTDEQTRVRAQKLLDQGSALYDKGDYVEALAKFSQANAVYPSPKLCFNIGQTDRNLGRPVAAMEAFEQVLAHASEVPGDVVATARSSVADLERELGQVSIRCDGAGAVISLDGKVIGTSPLPRPEWVTRGQHRLTARKAGHESAHEVFSLAAGSSVVIPIRLGPPVVLHAPAAGKAGFSTATTVPSGVEQAASGRKSWLLGHKWAWVATGAGVLLASGAATFGLLMKSKYDDLDRSCGSRSADWTGCSPSDFRSLNELRDTANVLWVAAGAATLTAGVLFFGEGRSWSITPMVGPTTGVLAKAGF